MSIEKQWCKRCGHSWYPRSEDTIKVCPECKSPYWDREKLTRHQRVVTKRLEKYYPCAGCQSPVQGKEAKMFIKDVFDNEGVVIGRCAIPYHPECYEKFVEQKERDASGV